MLASRRSAAVGFAAVGIIGLMLGGLLWGNLFTLITHEFPNPGPGFNTVIGFKADTRTILTTTHPENYVSFKLIPQIELWYWSATGRMTQNPDGSYDILLGEHAGVLTTDGQDFIEAQISGSASTTNAIYISLSSSTHTPVNSDHKLWGEIDTAGGLDRTGGTYTSTGVGAWTVAHQFTADTTYTAVQTTGLCWSDTDASNSTTLCEDVFTPVTLASSDKITVTWTLGVS